MPDVYAAIAEVEVATQERLAAILELRAADPQQRAMLDSYLSEVRFSPVSRVLEVGCGPGAVTRVLARWPEVAEAVGVDPSPVFVAKAGELASELGNASFEEGTVGRSASATATSTWSSATPCCATFRSRSAYVGQSAVPPTRRAPPKPAGHSRPSRPRRGGGRRRRGW